MKALKLAVAEPSAILRCGIIAVLRRLPAPTSISSKSPIFRSSPRSCRAIVPTCWSSTRLRWDFVRPSN